MGRAFAAIMFNPWSAARWSLFFTLIGCVPFSNERCTTAQDCDPGLMCYQRLCVVPDASDLDGGTSSESPVLVAEVDSKTPDVDAGILEVDAGIQCVPRTCSQFGGSCGQFDDGCGGALTCQCPCVPQTCATLQAVCGQNIPDGCGGAIPFCGNDCAPNSACSTAFKCECKSSVDDPDDEFVDSNCDGIDGEVGASIFVSAAGSDTNPGSPVAPVLSLERAFSLAATTGRKNVLVSEGTYVAPSPWPSGIHVFGGYSTQWLRDDRNRVTLVASSSAGLLFIGIVDATTVSRVAIVSGAPVAGSLSSVAARVVNCGTRVTFRSVSFLALEGGRGANGTAGPAGAPGTPGSAGQNALIDSTTGPLGGLGLATPPELSYRGGQGGATFFGTAQSGEGPGGGAGGQNMCVTVANGFIGQDGQPGADGTPGLPGATGPNASGPGQLDPNTGLWSPHAAMASSGSPGAPGSSGRGGGGGGALPCGGFTLMGSGGGGGGAGGSGGLPGTGGFSGGASIALVLVDSQPVLDRVIVRTTSGGAGGQGGTGGVGGDGAVGGLPGDAAQRFGTRSGLFVLRHQGSRGGSGGRGGVGGAGGRGGSGAPGPSVGIWCAQTSLMPSASVTFSVGAEGDGSPGVNVWGC
jgi:hypothetical protein